ncbi:MAG: hypothetical protein M1130_00570 [Actinobacteria bacterium]|nr:hypothetical protein [Actinomycetota bacterium]
MVEQVISDYSYFFYTLVVCGIIGVFAAIYKKPVEKIMAETEEKANGRTAHH